MTENITVAAIEKNLEPYRLIYDAIRVVDPVNKRIVGSLFRCGGNPDKKCSAYWENGEIGDNSLSLLAFRDDRYYVKLEQTDQTMTMLAALPITGSETPLVLELYKNISETLMIGDGDYSNGRFVRNLIHDINDLALKDEITKIYNRRFVDDRLPKDILKAAEQKKPLSVIFLDMDNLKIINDTFGHALGDKALTKVSDVLMHSIRTNTDWAARYGGDEFLICLFDTGGKEAYRIAERIRKKITEPVLLQDQKIEITASLGISSMENAPAAAAELIELADRRMYCAKKNGKNCSIYL